MLSETKLEKNKSIFLDTNQKYGVMTPELLEFLGDEFFTAPSSTSITMTGCYPGGLLNQLISTCKYSININSILPESLKQPLESIVRVVFLSQIGKVFTIKMSENERQIKQGKLYEFRDDVVRLRVGERSIYYALKYGVTLSEVEYQAILNLDKDDDDKMSRYFSEPLTDIIKMGHSIAIMEEKNGKK